MFINGLFMDIFYFRFIVIFLKKMNLSSSKMLAARLGSLGQVYTVTVP